MDKTYVVSRDQMYKLDARTMEDFAISSQVLMEIAGLKACQIITQRYIPANHNYLLVCSHGNNGGDGFVISRWLANIGAHVQILFVGKNEKMGLETSNNYKLCRQLEIPIHHDWSQVQLNSQTVIIDALLGIGFSGSLSASIQKLIHNLNECPYPKVAIDIPTGLDANTGRGEVAFKADLTITMGAIKTGMLLNSAPDYCGEISLVDISIPDKYYQDLDFYASLKSDMTYPHRYPNSHKGDYGKVLIIAGSPSFTGAGILSSRACVKAGAGLVKLIHPLGLENIFESALVEVMTKGIEDANDLDEYLDWADVVLIGPGIGKGNLAKNMVKKVLSLGDKPLVIDADGLNIISEDINLLSSSNKNIILTPHLGEFSRLVNLPLEQVKSQLLILAKKFVDKYQLSLFLKSSNSVYLDSKQAIFVSTGNDGLSTGGSGDVLAGVISSFLAQGMNLADSATNASYYIGKIAEILVVNQASFSITPSHIINSIGQFDIR